MSALTTHFRKPMLKENLSVKGLVSFLLTDADGHAKHSSVQNLVVSSGLAVIISRMKDATAAVASHMALGTSTTIAAASQTALIAEVARVALDSTTLVTTTVTNDSIQYVATFGPGTGTAGLTEAGLLNAATDGTMIARTAFPVINKGALDTLAITWKLTLA